MYSPRRKRELEKSKRETCYSLRILKPLVGYVCVHNEPKKKKTSGPSTLTSLNISAIIQLWSYYYYIHMTQPTPVLLPGKSHGQKSLVGYSLWGR